MDAVCNQLRAPGSSNCRTLRRYSGRSEHNVRRFLTEQDAYTLHKPRRIRFPRRKTYSKGIGDFYHIDLVDLSSLAPQNDGMRYLLTCINVFWKRCWAIPVRTKYARDVTRAFETVLEDGKCNMVQCDKGTEFLNSAFQTMLKRHGIKFYTSEKEDLKTAVVEQ